MCWARGLRHALARNGNYRRRFSKRDGEPRPGPVYRRKCSRCRTSYSLLPDSALAGHTHGRDRVALWLHLSLDGESFRSRRFFGVELGIQQPADDPSWTDHLDSRSPRPAPSRLRAWTRQANRRALTWLAPLALACLAAGCRLRSGLREAMEPLSEAPHRAAPLALVLGLLAWLRSAPPDLELMKALVTLLSHSPPRVSHDTSRALSRPSGYAAAYLDLRAPPAWVRAIPIEGGLQE